MHQCKSSFCLLHGHRLPVLPPFFFSSQRSLVPSLVLRMLCTHVDRGSTVDRKGHFNASVYASGFLTYTISIQIMCSPQGKPLDSWNIEDVYYFVETTFSVEVAVKFKGTVQGCLFTFWRAILFSRHFVVSMIVFINLIHKMVLSNNLSRIKKT